MIFSLHVDERERQVFVLIHPYQRNIRKARFVRTLVRNRDLFNLVPVMNDSDLNIGTVILSMKLRILFLIYFKCYVF